MTPLNRGRQSTEKHRREPCYSGHHNALPQAAVSE
jgi:hypothetical protein